MKKYILTLIAVACSVMSIYAMNLKEAYHALSNLPRISTELNDTISVSVNRNVVAKDLIMKVSGAHNLDREGILTAGNATLAVLNQVPLSHIINGGCNGYVGAFVYCTPNESGYYDMLIVTMSGEQGDLTYMFVTGVDENSKQCLQEGKLTLHGSSLSLIPSNPNGFIGAIKVNCR